MLYIITYYNLVYIYAVTLFFKIKKYGWGFQTFSSKGKKLLILIWIWKLKSFFFKGIVLNIVKKKHLKKLYYCFYN